ncbi:MAG: hypothetical protein RBU37_18345 [Myxococcota bacterium]|jgi:hypothetical protein|nr:hypothetical protein [Myxococcota bacterium]
MTGEWQERRFVAPYDKKRKSYTRDRRNAYGESPHAARKAIPLRKRQRLRIERAKAKLLLQQPDESGLEALELRLADAQQYRKQAWKKHPDIPLREKLEHLRQRRGRLV